MGAIRPGLPSEELRGLTLRAKGAVREELLELIVAAPVRAPAPDRLSSFLRMSGSDVPVIVALILGSRHSPSATAFDALLTFAPGARGFARIATFWALSRCVAEQPELALTRVLQHAADPDVILAVLAESLASMKVSKGLLDLACQLATDDAPAARSLACRILARGAALAFVRPVLEVALDDLSEEVAGEAAHAMSVSPSREYFFALSARLRTTQGRLLVSIGEALSRFPAELAQEVLAQSDPGAAASAARLAAIRWLPGVQYSSALVPFLRSREATVRREAAVVLRAWVQASPPGTVSAEAMEAATHSFAVETDPKTLTALAESLLISLGHQGRSIVTLRLGNCPAAARPRLFDLLAVRSALETPESMGPPRPKSTPPVHWKSALPPLVKSAGTVLLCLPVVAVVGWVGAPYLSAQYLATIACLILAPLEILRQRRWPASLRMGIIATSGSLPKVTVVMSAHGEEVSIGCGLASIRGLAYPHLEILVVDDGSRDRTLAVLNRELDLCPMNVSAAGFLPTEPLVAHFRSRIDPRVCVLAKRNGGKADGLNCGINFATGEFILVLDADVELESDALLNLVGAVLANPDVVVATGMIRPTGMPGRLLSIQALEYIRAFSLGRLFFNRLNSHVVVSGAFGLFRRSIVVEVGGYNQLSVGEDMELVVRILKSKHGQSGRIEFVADALCWTQAPKDFSELAGQRARWQRGLLSTLSLHRDMFFSLPPTAVGWFGLPFAALFELIGPALELAGWLYILLALLFFPPTGLTFMVVTLFLGLVTSVLAVCIDSAFFDLPRKYVSRAALLSATASELILYRQMLCWSRLKAMIFHLSKSHTRAGWQSPSRQVQAR